MDLLKLRIEKRLHSLIQEVATDTHELELLDYIFQGGKRLRPMICLAVGDSFRDQSTTIENIATAIEIIHNASLIIDDLPSMDNDLYRRGQMTVHHKYGETVALQVALKLMTVALNLIFKSVPNNKIYTFNKIIHDNLGSNGLPYGQYLDINLLKKRLHLGDHYQHRDLIFKKTTTLFNLSFLLAYALYTDDPNQLAIMEKASKWFGLAFQIYDDFTDIQQDTDHNSPNFVVQFGRLEAYQLFHKAVQKNLDYLTSLEINPAFFYKIFGLLQNKVHM